MLSPVLHAASGYWFLGKIENHVARPLTEEEISAHIKEYDVLRKQALSKLTKAGAEAVGLTD